LTQDTSENPREWTRFIVTPDRYEDLGGESCAMQFAGYLFSSEMRLFIGGDNGFIESVLRNPEMAS